jgi:hypothetical protein
VHKWACKPLLYVTFRHIMLQLCRDKLKICQSNHFLFVFKVVTFLELLTSCELCKLWSLSLFQAPAGTCRQVDLKFKLSRIPMGAPTPHFNKISHSDIKCLYFISLFYVLILLVAQAASQFLRIQVRPLNEAHDQQGAKQPHLQV